MTIREQLSMNLARFRVSAGSMPRYICPYQLLYITLFVADLFQFVYDVHVCV